MDFLILIVAIVFGVYIGWEARERYAMHIVNGILESLEEEAEESEEDSERDRLRLERHGEMIYAYTDSGEFLAQGVDLLELDAAIQKRFPGRKFLIKKENLEEVGVEHEHI